MSLGYFKITEALLCELLHLPSDTMFKCAGVDDRGDVILTVESSQIKPSTDGKIPEVRPMWSRHEPIQFDGWGQE